MNFLTQVNATAVDAGTNNTAQTLNLVHDSTGTPTTNFGVAMTGYLKDSTTNDQVAGDIRFYWGQATHGDTNGGIQLRPARVGTVGPAIDCQNTVFGTAIGFYGSTPVTAQNQVDVVAGLNTLGLLTGACTFNASQLRYQVPVNPIHNATFNVWQRGTSFLTVANNAYTADRWQYIKSGTMVHTVAQSTDVPSVSAGQACLSNYSLKLSVTTAEASLGTGDYAGISQSIEGYDWLPFAQQPLTLNFWVKPSLSGTYCVAFRNSGSDRSYVAEYTTIGGLWQQACINIPASPTAGTWNYTNGIGCNITFTQACGTTKQTTPNAWNTGNFLGTSNQVNAVNSTSNTFEIAQVMLQTGSGSGNGVTTPMVQPIPYQEDLAKCQRYCQVYSGQVIGLALGTNVLYNQGAIVFPVTMRAAPSLASGATFSVNVGSAGTPALYAPQTTGTGFFNNANNWTTNAVVQINGTLTADL